MSTISIAAKPNDLATTGTKWRGCDSSALVGLRSTPEKQEPMSQMRNRILSRQGLLDHFVAYERSQSAIIVSVYLGEFHR